VRCVPLHLMEGRWGSLWAWVERCAQPDTPWLRLSAPWAARVVLARLVLGSSPAFAANAHGRPRLERLCTYCREHCGVLAVEDEYHVGCECPAFDRPRQIWWAALLRVGAFVGGRRAIGGRGSRASRLASTDDDSTGCPWGGSLFWLFVSALLSASPAAAIASAKFFREVVYMKGVVSGTEASATPWGAASGTLRSTERETARIWAASLQVPPSFPYSDQPAHRMLRRSRPGVLRMAPTAAEARAWVCAFAARRASWGNGAARAFGASV